MGVCRDINALVPEMQKRTRATMKALSDAGIKAAIFETDRSQAVQDAYYAQGRLSLDEVNKLRTVCGLYQLTEAENKKVITQTKHSRHIGGNAVDIVPLTSSGNWYWNAPLCVWKSIGEIAERNGLDWCYGGKGENWQWDMPHYELLKEWKTVESGKAKELKEASELAKQALENV